MLFSSSKLLLIVVGASILAVGYGWRAVRRVLRRGLPPWEAEPHWRGRRRGATVTSRALFVRATMVVAVVLAALGASRSFARGPVEKTSADVALLVVAPVAAFAAWRGFRASALGSTTLTWDRFPLFVGEAAELSFGVGPSGGAFEDVEFTLRCVAAWPGRELNGRPEVAVLHREELRPALADARPAADTFVPLRLRLVDVA